MTVYKINYKIKLLNKNFNKEILYVICSRDLDQLCIYYKKKMVKKQHKKPKTHLEKITDRKLKNEKLVKIGESLLDNNKIKMSKKTLININNCGSWLQFLADKKLEKHKLYQGNFCTNRFCPICSKKKAIKDAVELKVITEYVTKYLKRQYIFVTFTAPNVNGEHLSEEIKKYNKALDRLFKRDKYQKIVKGYIRKLEVTYNNNKKSKSYGTYHPHFHVLISVNSSYFTDKKLYIKRDEWLKDWQDVMQDKTITQVDVRRLQTQSKNMLDKSILELTKYIAKDSNYLENEEVFLNFYQGLKGKRQYAYGGDFKLAREKLKNGELEEYYFKDETEWYWLITNKWQGKIYSEEKEIYEEEKTTI